MSVNYYDSTNDVLVPIPGTETDAYAPESHASSDTTYGVGTTSNYGHNLLVDDLTATSHTDGQALSAHMGNALGQMVAPIETSTTVARTGGYASGEQFVYNGILYTADTDIDEGGTIDVGNNCSASDPITSQISDLSARYKIIQVVIPSISYTADVEVSSQYDISSQLTNGYEGIGIIGYNSNISMAVVRRLFISDNTVYYSITSPVTTTIGLTLYVLEQLAT